MNDKQVLEESKTDEKTDNELDYQEKNAKIEKEIRRLN